MTHHWSKNIEYESNQYFRYKGLKFPAWKGPISQDERRSGAPYYAFFGSIKLTGAAIRYRVDRMIERGVLQETAA